jgi:hypothetical protein
MDIVVALDIIEVSGTVAVDGRIKADDAYSQHLIFLK